MARRKSKLSAKERARRAEWRKCAGVNSRTGRILKNHKPRKGGGCPIPVAAKAAAPRKKRETKKDRIARSYHSGGRGASAGYDAWKRSQAEHGTYDPGAVARHYREEHTGIEGARYRKYGRPKKRWTASRRRR